MQSPTYSTLFCDKLVYEACGGLNISLLCGYKGYENYFYQNNAGIDIPV